MHLVFESQHGIIGWKYSDRYLSDFVLPAVTVHCTFTTAACKNMKISQTNCLKTVNHLHFT